MENKFKKFASSLLVAGNLFGASLVSASAMGEGTVATSENCIVKFVSKANDFFCKYGKKIGLPNDDVSKAVGYTTAGAGATEIFVGLVKGMCCLFGSKDKNTASENFKINSQNETVKLSNGETVDIVTNTTLTFKNADGNVKEESKEKKNNNVDCSKVEDGSDVKKEENKLPYETFSSRFESNISSKCGGKTASRYGTFSSRFAEKYGSGSTLY